MHAGGGFLGDALDVLLDIRIEVGRFSEAGADRREGDLFFLGARIVEHGDVFLCLGAEVDQHGGVAAVVENHVRGAAVVPLHDLVGVLPVVFQRLALDCEHRHAISGNRGSGVILGREDVAGCPAHLGAERDQGFDQNRGLDGHVQRASDARALERLLGSILAAQRYQARHFCFGNRDFFSTPVGEREVSNLVVVFDDVLRVSTHK